MHFNTLLLLIAAPLLQASPLAASKAKPAGKSWLGLTTGCTPTACKTSTCKRDDLSLRNADSLLPRGQATLAPADKTEKGLNDWTKEVWAATKHNLDINGGGAGETPTSQLVQWEKTGLQFATVGGLYGCASVIVVSTCGVYMTHHWGNPMADEVLSSAPFMWNNEFTNPIEGLGKVTGTSAADLKEAYITEKELDALYPTSGWTSLKDAAPKCFEATNKPQAIVVVHNGNGGMTHYTKAGPKMAEIVKKMVPALSKTPEVVQYANGATDPRTQSENAADYHGKVIVSYDPAKQAYQVWMAGVKLTAPILEGPL